MPLDTAHCKTHAYILNVLHVHTGCLHVLEADAEQLRRRLLRHQLRGDWHEVPAKGNAPEVAIFWRGQLRVRKGLCGFGRKAAAAEGQVHRFHARQAGSKWHTCMCCTVSCFAVDTGLFMCASSALCSLCSATAALAFSDDACLCQLAARSSAVSLSIQYTNVLASRVCFVVGSHVQEYYDHLKGTGGLADTPFRAPMLKPANEPPNRGPGSLHEEKVFNVAALEPLLASLGSTGCALRLKKKNLTLGYTLLHLALMLLADKVHAELRDSDYRPLFTAQMAADVSSARQCGSVALDGRGLCVALDRTRLVCSSSSDTSMASFVLM